ncbi:MAG: hypothetical protein B7Y32_00800 [Methylophilales bacterium 16-45-7]|nr:MAG: hypothetical protein B7Y32_00800 [Methylophilales bacterium 16-45-7]
MNLLVLCTDVHKGKDKSHTNTLSLSYADFYMIEFALQTNSFEYVTDGNGVEFQWVRIDCSA